MHKFFLINGAVMAALSVAIGAFGAHKFKAILQANARYDVFETAVKYQMYHALALLLVGILLMKTEPQKWFSIAGYSFLAGIVLFSGSLYVLCITNVSKWGAVTPFGGLFFIAGWLFLVAAIVKMQP